MLGEIFGGLWKKMPVWLRLKVIRVTQKKFTASVGVIITNDAGKVLLLEHFMRPASGWGIPGGFIEYGEQPEDAVRRELREEIGINVENIEMFRVRTFARHIEMLFRAESNDVPRVSSREIRNFGWFEVNAMPEDLDRSQKMIIRKVLQDEI